MVSSKRTRSIYESDDSSLFALYGSPLPATWRNSGSFVPLHLQEVHDDHGRRRFHGAFTGGWSAGYFNTVGSREGWTPSTFVSSRAERASIKGKFRSQRPEDFMDEEDLQEAQDERQIESTCANTGDLLSKQDLPHDIFQLGLLSDDSVGSRLMGKMGWKPGQGTGPMVLRPVRFQTGCIETADSKEYLFAPDDVEVPLLRSKPERHGLGFDNPLQASMRTDQVDANQNSTKPTRRVHLSEATERVPSRKSWNRQAPLIGVSLDNDYDDDSDQDLGPRLTYAKPKVSKTKAKQLTTTLKTSVKRNPTALAIGRDLHHIVPGFTLPLRPVTLSVNASSTMYTPLEVPKGWSPVVPAKQALNKQSSSGHTLVHSSLRERSSAIGETPLPGKSIFDFITPESRAKLALVSGNTMLPLAHGESIPGSATITSIADVYTTSPALDREAALAALARAKVAGGPYSADPTKYHRYIMYLRVQAKQLDPADISSEMSVAELKLELAEFFNCARIFRPMTGFMATRFAPSSSQSMTNTSEEHKTQLKADDPAYEAAKLGMFGHLTRSTVSFTPVRLLYKRFNIPMPAHSAVPEERERPPPTPENETADNLSRDTSNPMSHSTRSDNVAPGRPADDVFQDIFGGD